MQEAIQATLATIERRARLYRRTVMAVVAIALASPAAALILRSWHPLAGWILLVPVVGGFFVLDESVVWTWRAGLLRAWLAGRMDLAAFAQAVSTHPMLPPQTLRAMLASLPLPSVPTEARGGAWRRLRTDHRRQQARTVAGGAAVTILLACLVAAAWLRWPAGALVSALPLAGWVLVRACRHTPSSTGSE